MLMYALYSQIRVSGSQIMLWIFGFADQDWGHVT